MNDLIRRSDVVKSLVDYVDGKKTIGQCIDDVPSVQLEQDWSYDDDTKEITLIVPEDVYDSTETIFLSVGYEGQLGLRGMIYSAQPEKGEWIPVSERTPDESGFYNVSVINMHDRAYTKCAYYNKDHDCWHSKQKIVAWMPLLEPYKGKGTHEVKNELP